MNLIAHLRKTRDQLGMSQFELAHRSGVSVPSIQNIEAEKGNPSLKTLESLARALGCTLRIEIASVDWNRLSELGVPIFKESAKKNPSRKFSLSADALIQELQIAAQELSQKRVDSSDFERKSEALQATLVAIRDHYPSLYKQWFSQSSLIRSFVPSVLNSRIIKLKRQALARISTYL